MPKKRSTLLARGDLGDAKRAKHWDPTNPTEQVPKHVELLVTCWRLFHCPAMVQCSIRVKKKSTLID